ncbi:hypothetical protein C8Q78DRAFT_982722, partial [Trametes maxima]
LLAYDHLLTFSGEVQFVWGRKFSGATVVFLLNRYVTLFGKILLPISTLWWPHQTDKVRKFECPSCTLVLTWPGRPRSCAAPVILTEIFTVVAYFVVAVFSALRVYAVWNKDWRPFVVVLVIALSIPVTNMVMSIVTHSSAVVADLLVVVLTWVRTYKIKKLATVLRSEASISVLLLRDGGLSFHNHPWTVTDIGR